MKTLSIFLIFSLLVGCLPQTKTEPRGMQLSILQGATNSTTANFNILAKASQKLTFSYYDSKNQQEKKINSFKVNSRDFSSYITYHLKIKWLSPNKDYRLKIYDNGNLIDERNFRSLDTKKQEVRFMVASCLSDAPSFKDIYEKIWPEALAHQPEVIFLIGDNVYTDATDNGTRGDSVKSEADLWERYIRARLRLPIFYNGSLYPLLATWDDYDFGTNDGSSEFYLKAEAKRTFHAFYAQSDEKVVTYGPGVAVAWNAFDQRFLLLDDRYFRTTNNKKISTQSHWGKEQEKWLLKKLNSSRKPTWLLNGNQFWSDYHSFESYKNNHPESFKKMMPQIGKAKSPVIFVSGDRHMTELAKIEPPDFPYTTYELTSSGLHAQIYPRIVELPKGIIYRDNSHYNYAIIDSSRKGANLKVKITSYGLGKAKLFEHNFSLKK